MKKVALKVFTTMLLMMSVTCVKGQTTATEYKIKRGETIESVAQAHGVTVDDIIKANPNTDGNFYAGMKIVIPAKSSSVYEKDEKQNIQQEDNNVGVTNIINTIQTEENETIKNKDIIPNERIMSFDLLYQSKAKVYGFAFNGYATKYIIVSYGMSSNLKFGKDDLNTMAFYFGVGLGNHIIYNDNFYIQGKIYHYLGYGSYDVLKLDKYGKLQKDDKSKFLYGAIADLSVGLKLLETKKGNDIYLNLGYMVDAGEFKTKDVIKNGMIMVGITTVFKD